MCSMKESIKNKVFSCSPVESNGRKQSHRLKLLTKCTNQFCVIVAKTYNPEESKFSKLSTFQGPSCFEIAHTNECNGLLHKIKRKMYHYMRTIPSHVVAKSLGNLYSSELPRKSSQSRNPGRPPKAIHLGCRSKLIDNNSLTADSGLYTSTPPTRSPAQNDNKNDVRITRNVQQKPATRRSTSTSTLKAKHTGKRQSRRMNVAYI